MTQLLVWHDSFVSVTWQIHDSNPQEAKRKAQGIGLEEEEEEVQGGEYQ